MEKGKERKKRKRRPGAFTSEEGQVGRRHEAQRKHIHVDARSGWTSQASQRQSECQKRFFRQRRQKDTQAQKKDKRPCLLAGKSLGCAVTPTTCRTRPEERPRTSEVSCYLYNARHGKTDGDAYIYACMHAAVEVKVFFYLSYFILLLAVF